MNESHTDSPCIHELRLAERLLDRAHSDVAHRRVFAEACRSLADRICRTIAGRLRSLRREQARYRGELRASIAHRSLGWCRVLEGLIAARGEEIARLTKISTDATFLLLQLPVAPSPALRAA